MDTYRLQIFLECVRLKNFSRAAETLHVSQPSISLHIRELEEWCGTSLFLRRGRKVELTDAGELLKGHAERVLASLTTAKQEVQEVLGLGKGRLAVGGAGLPGTYLLPKALSRFKAHYPKLEIYMRYGVSDQIEQLLYEDAVEIGMFSRQPKLRGLVSEHYGSSDMVIAAAAGHRLTRRRSITLEEIAGEPFILREPQSSGGELVRRYFAKRKLSLNVAIELSSHESIKVAVAEGLGIAAVARRWLINEIALKQIAVLKVPDFKLAIDHRVVHRQEKRLSQAATNFLQFLRDLKPELSRLLS